MKETLKYRHTISGFLCGLLVAALLILTACEKYSIQTVKDAQDCGDSIKWINHINAELLIEIGDDVANPNSTFWFYPYDVVKSTSYDGGKYECLLGKYYKASILIDNREWVFLKDGVVETVNVFELE